MEAPTQTATHRLTKAGKRSLLRRIVNSAPFASSPALQSFLSFIVEHEIDGALEEIREQRIGSEVLGRRSDYNPAEDNIVRVRAHELRERLAKYFSTVGSRELVELIIPKGGYVPVFQPRVRSLAAAASSEAAPRDVPVGREFNWTAAQSAAVQDFWAPFLGTANRELRVVVADAAFALW